MMSPIQAPQYRNRNHCKSCSGPPDSMSSLFQPADDGLSRRGFLRVGFGGLLGLLLSRWSGTPGYADKPAKARACILLWLNGGPSHLDTWDPKPNHRNGGPFRAINTSIKGIQICEHLPRVAEQAHHLAVLRSMTSREGSHERAQYLVHNGYIPNPTVQHPSLGSIVGAELGDPNFDLPSFVSICGGTFGAGFLGVANDPFVVSDPTRPVDNLDLPEGVNVDRFRRRLQFLNYFETRIGQLTGDAAVTDRDAVYRKAVRMMTSPLRRAFDLRDEPQAVREAYGGEKSLFGQGCLMARRLVETGVRFVEVRSDGWDTHTNNFMALEKKLTTELDPGMAALISDLDRRGLLKSTLVLCMGEFGRTPRINENEGRDHFPAAWCAVLAGGGVRGGQVIGQTNEDASAVVDRPVHVPDLFATLCSLFGIDATKVRVTPAGRPIRVVDKEGVVVPELVG